MPNSQTNISPVSVLISPSSSTDLLNKEVATELQLKQCESYIERRVEEAIAKRVREQEEKEATEKAAAAEKQALIEMDPILNPSNDKYVMFPVDYHSLWTLYEKSVDCFWSPNEIVLADDIADWNTKLTDDERNFIGMILAFFAGSDGIVLENLAGKFITEVQISEARAFYGIQIAVETLHSHTYSLLIDTYIQDEAHKSRLFKAMDKFPCIQKKADWAKRWIGSDEPFATRCVAFACVEGIFFSGAFCSIFWMKHRGLMPGLCTSNELISRDEALHCEFAVELHSKLLVPCPNEKIQAVIRDAVEIEHEFICEALPCNLIGINAPLMKKYICFVANRLSLQLGAPKIYPEAVNPFPWMESISIQTKTNMFEHVVSEYALASNDGRETAFDGIDTDEYA